jgi:hypothetical protein
VALSNEAVNAKSAVQSLTDENEKKQVVEQLNSETFPTDNAGRTLIWVILLVGLFVIAGAAIIAAANLGSDKDPSAYIAVTSAVVAGVIGLFAKSPTT